MIRAAESGLGIAFVYQSLVTQQLSAGPVHLLPDYRYPADHFASTTQAGNIFPPPAGLYRPGDGAE